MYRMSMITILAICAMALSFSAASAHCGSCGVGDEAPAGHADMHGHGDMSALPEGHVMEMPLVCPGGCGMSGGLCGGCAPMAEEMMREMAVEFCPTCDDPNALCEMCDMGVSGGMDMLRAGMQPTILMVPAHNVAYMQTTMEGMGEVFGEVMGAGFGQGLVNDNTKVVSVMPDAMTTSEGPDMTIYAGFVLDEGAEAADPLSVYEFPGGAYMMSDYVGPYEGMAAGWMAAFTYGNLMGIEWGTGPCGEHYVSDPETTPEDELLTQIYIPVAGHTDGRQEMPAGHPDPHAGHGHG